MPLPPPVFAPFGIDRLAPKLIRQARFTCDRQARASPQCRAKVRTSLRTNLEVSVVARGKKRVGDKPGRSISAGIPTLTLEEGRRQLHELSHRFDELEGPSESLLERARSVGPYRKGGLVILPEIDARAAVERLEEAERDKEELLEELEDMGIILLAQERLTEPTPADQLISLEELARSFGRGRLLGD